MKLKLLLVSSIILFFNCAPEKGIPTEFAAACNLENNDKVLEVSGFISDDGSVYCSSTSGRYECGFKLLGDPISQKGFSINIKVGSSSNSVEKMESGYTQKDIRIYDDEGIVIPLDKKVTVTGKIRIAKDPDEVCYLKVSKIEIK